MFSKPTEAMSPTSSGAVDEYTDVTEPVSADRKSHGPAMVGAVYQVTMEKPPMSTSRVTRIAPRRPGRCGTASRDVQVIRSTPFGECVNSTRPSYRWISLQDRWLPVVAYFPISS
jgi:hypothetical protein